MTIIFLGFVRHRTVLTVGDPRTPENILAKKITSVFKSPRLKKKKVCFVSLALSPCHSRNEMANTFKSELKRGTGYKGSV